MQNILSSLPILCGTACLLILFTAERFRPLRSTTRELFPRLLVNATITLSALLIAMIAVKPAVALAFNTTAQRIGIVPLLGTDPILSGILGFLLLDLSFYYWHLLNHQVPILWRFHNVHHLDPDLDVSTALRFHPVEIFLSTVFRVSQVVLIGVSPTVFLVYEVVLQLNTLFHHSNVRLPFWFERWLNLILVTPRMHGVHHSNIKSEAFSNYSVVFPWWDAVHRTLCLNVSQSELEIGVPGYAQDDDNSLPKVFLLPFQAQREYWKDQSGRSYLKRESASESLRTKMKE